MISSPMMFSSPAKNGSAIASPIMKIHAMTNSTRVGGGGAAAGIDDAVVLVNGEQQRLEAHVVGKAEVNALRNHLAQHLPE